MPEKQQPGLSKGLESRKSLKLKHYRLEIQEHLSMKKFGKNSKSLKKQAEMVQDPADNTPWISRPRLFKLDFYEKDYTNVLNINRSFPDLEKPEDFTMELTPHQMKVVPAMLDLQERQLVHLYGMHVNNSNMTLIQGPVIETRAGILRDRTGSGKTHIMLAVICLRKKIKRMTEISSLPGLSGHVMYKEHFYYAGAASETRVRYKKIIPCNLIFVNKNIIDQIVKVILEHTKLRTFVISDVYHMREFYEIAFNPRRAKHSITDFDVILVKNGHISGAFDVPELKDSPLYYQKIKPFISLFGELFKDAMFEQIWFDDFDTLGISNDAMSIPALFTWFISATKNKATGFAKNKKTPHNIENILDNYRPKYNEIMHNQEIFTFCSIGTDADYINQSMSASKVDFHVYVHKNPNSQIIGAIGEFGGDAKILQEMLNADATQTAGKKAGMKASSVSEIFEKILGDNHNEYVKAWKIVKYGDSVKVYVTGLPGLNDPKKMIGSSRITDFRANLERPGPKTWIDANIKHNESVLIGTITEIQSSWLKVKEEKGKALTRVKDNLKSGDCPITCEPLKDCKGVVIMKCCGVVISVEAAGIALKIKDGNTNVHGECPNCRRKIDATHIVMVDKEINLDNIVDDQIDAVTEAKVIETEVVDDSKPKPEPTEKDDLDVDGKYNTIVKLIKYPLAVAQEKLKEFIQPKTKLVFPSLMIGDIDKGEAAHDDRKFLIFANYGETLEIIESKLDQASIPYSVLKGRREITRETLKKYHLPNSNPDSIKVLLVDGMKFAAGLDLQITTDLIYAHHIVNKNLRGQVAGRAGRFGRTNNLNIHFVLYDNEHMLD